MTQISLDSPLQFTKGENTYIQTLPKTTGVYKAAIILNDSQLLKEVFVNFDKETNKVNIIFEGNIQWRNISQGATEIYFERSLQQIDYGRQDISLKRTYPEVWSQSNENDN